MYDKCNIVFQEKVNGCVKVETHRHNKALTQSASSLMGDNIAVGALLFSRKVLSRKRQVR